MNGKMGIALLVSAAIPIAVLSFSSRALGQDQKLTRQDIMIVLSSHTAKERFNACASMYSAPPEVKFTFIIDEGGKASLGGTEPEVHGYLEACFVKVLGGLGFKATGKKFKIAYSMTFAPEKGPEMPELGPPWMEPVQLHPGTKAAWKKGKTLSIVGLAVMGIGCASYFAGLGVAWRGVKEGSDRYFEGMVSSMAFLPVILGGGIISLVGLSVKRLTMKKSGIIPSPASAVLGWITLGAGFVLSLTTGPTAMIENLSVTGGENGGSRKYTDTGNVLTGFYTAGGALLFVSLVFQAIQLGYLEKKSRGAWFTETSLLPLVAYTGEPRSGAHIMSLTWTY
jgi:hypothetical protein